ncbi:MAG: hypothetical protein JKX68_10125 [Flavobacteriales bacterium]|nr:hypothetical protein [Flavobacteriales bacterium]
MVSVFMGVISKDLIIGLDVGSTTVKAVVMNKNTNEVNASDRDYTTTIPLPNETLTFQINEEKLFIKDDVEEAIHKKLAEFEPIA